MFRIVRLPPATASLIAAGEVVERPVSALKELVENALDAGARHVEVRVHDGLDTAFEVADDGGGIEADDLPLALERHATSKIRTHDDLERLSTLGFRGEALPSIAAVSRLRIASRTPDAQAASVLSATGGAVDENATAARAVGTTVEVRDLFFNTPARRKFMRTRQGEIRAALRVLEGMALAYPEVAFRYEVDGHEKLGLPIATSGRARAMDLLGSHVAGQMLEVEAERGAYRLWGLLGLPEQARAGREGQVILVNRRLVQSPLVGQALRQAYGNLLPQGRYPAAILSLTVPAEKLDVNVHPTKRDVRFAEDSRVFELVAGPCAQRLAALHPPLEVVRGGMPEPEAPWETRVREGPPQQGYLPLLHALPLAAAAAVPLAPAAEVQEEPTLWQLHRTYILAPVRGGLIIVDQHAAHERILYEQARARLEGERGASQQLLLPVLVDLSRDHFEMLLELGPWLKQLGWEITPMGAPTVVIQGTPSGLRRDQPGRMLQDILDGVSDDPGGDAHRDVSERLARSFACHAAVRAGETLTQQEMRALVDRLFATALPHGDPHGRPTFVRVELEELHRRFGRG